MVTSNGHENVGPLKFIPYRYPYHQNIVLRIGMYLLIAKLYTSLWHFMLLKQFCFRLQVSVQPEE